MSTLLKHSPENAHAILRELGKRGKKARINNQNSRKQENLKSRFGTDDRTYSEKNLRWRNLSEYGSYLGQLISVSGAGYSVIKLIYEPSIGGWMATILFVAALLVFEAIQRWTSDEFWDRKEAGDFSLKYAFLNFVVIWGMSAILTLGGIFFLSKDTQGDPMMYNDPQVASIRSQIEKLEAENTDYKTNSKYQVSGGKDKGEIRWEFQQAIGSNTRQIEALNASLNDRFGVTAMIDLDAMNYHKLVGESRMWLYVGLSFLCLVLFEVCMWYRSKYDRIKYTEDVLSGEIEDPGFLAYLRGK
jgi:hypothetical protein